MATFLVLEDATIRTDELGTTSLNAGDLIEDDEHNVSELQGQGAAIIAYVPGTMATPRDRFLRTKNASLVSVLLADGAL